MTRQTVLLTGHDLDLQQVTLIAGGAEVTLSEPGLARMDQSHAIMHRAIEDKKPVYGVTTGLGPKVVSALDEASIQSFPLSTLRGRAHTAGTPLDASLVRASLAVRTNTLLIGASGVRSGLARFIADCINKNAIPVVGETASIGAADLLWGATSGLALAGEGQMWDHEGLPASASQVLKTCELDAWQPDPREGLALASHAGFSAAIAAIGVHQLSNHYVAAQTAATFSIEAFRANLSPISKAITDLHPDKQTEMVAADLRHRLNGSLLFDAANCRRLQDPLSLRNIVQVHAAVNQTIEQARVAVACELNAVTDNPSVIIESESVISHGGYLAPGLSLALVNLGQSAVHLAAQQMARVQKMLFRRFSGLPDGLAPEDASVAGLGPLLKVVEALLAEIIHLANPPVIYPSPSADSLEDTVTHIAIPAKSLLKINEKLAYLAAIEMLVATHAIRLRGVELLLPENLRRHYQALSKQSPALSEDRSLTAELELFASQIRQGKFSAV